MTTYICTLYYPPGDTHDLPRSVLLPSGPIKRPSQHSVAIWQLLSSSPSEEKRGLRGEGGRSRYAREHVYFLCTCIHPLTISPSTSTSNLCPSLGAPLHPPCQRNSESYVELTQLAYLSKFLAFKSRIYYS